MKKEEEEAKSKNKRNKEVDEEDNNPKMKRATDSHDSFCPQAAAEGELYEEIEDELREVVKPQESISPKAKDKTSKLVNNKQVMVDKFQEMNEQKEFEKELVKEEERAKERFKRWWKKKKWK